MGRDHSTYIITGVSHFVFFEGAGRDHSTYIITGISNLKFVWGVGRDHSTCITVGSEATNPGHHRYHQSKWSLDKAPMYDTILGESTSPVNSGIAESHLTHHRLQRVRQELKQQTHQWKVAHGAPAPPLSAKVGTVGGRVVEWPPSQWDTARVQVAAVLSMAMLETPTPRPRRRKPTTFSTTSLSEW